MDSAFGRYLPDKKAKIPLRRQHAQVSVVTAAEARAQYYPFRRKI